MKAAIFASAIRGDVTATLREAKRRKLSASDQLMLAKLKARITGKSQPKLKCKDPWVRELVAVYSSYYRLALTGKLGAESGDKWLLEHLQPLSKQKSLKRLEVALKTELRKRGYRSIVGKILPHRSLSIWRSQIKKRITVELPFGTAKVELIEVRDLIHHGWMDFATLGHFYPSGWVSSGDDKIHYVEKSYRGGKNAFETSILKHEGQHALDLKRYPKLNQADLEYRAKLAELIYSKTPKRLLTRLLKQAKKDPSSPHAYAAWKLQQDFEGFKKIRERAKELLAANEALLRKSGRMTKSILLN